MSGSDAQSSYAPQLLTEYTVGFMTDALSCILYGIYITIAVANLSLLREKRFKILMIFTIFQLVITTFYIIILMYSGPTQLLSVFGLFSGNDISALSPWNDVARGASFLVNMWASDAFLLYRCHVVWRGNKHAVALPVLIYLTTVGASIAWLILGAAPGAVHNTPGNLFSGITVFSCSTAMNVTASALISGRLLYYRREICQVAGPQQGRFYLSYLSMTLESAMMYTVFVIITLVMFMINSLLLNIFFVSLGIVQVIAPSLIVFRIARGISFETHSYGSRIVSTVHFAPGPVRGQADARDAFSFPGTMKTSLTQGTKV